jgi:hypothetical protein
MLVTWWNTIDAFTISTDPSLKEGNIIDELDELSLSDSDDDDDDDGGGGGDDDESNSEGRWTKVNPFDGIARTSAPNRWLSFTPNYDRLIRKSVNVYKIYM